MCSWAPGEGVDAAWDWVHVRRGDLRLQWGLEARPWDACLGVNPSSATETEGRYVWTPAFPVAPCPHLQSEATAECALWEAVMIHEDVNTRNGWVMSSTPAGTGTWLAGRGLGHSAGHGLVARLTGWWGSSRTWSCTGQWVGGRSSSRHQLPPPSFLLLGFPGPRYHLQAQRPPS